MSGRVLRRIDDDGIQDLIAIFRASANALKRLPRASERKQELERFNRALKAILAKNRTAELMFKDVEPYETLLTSAKLLADITDKSLATKLPKGLEPDNRKWLFTQLASIFENRSGKRASIYWSEDGDCFKGEFFEFVLKHFRPIAPFQNKNALGGAIRDTLKDRKKE